MLDLNDKRAIAAIEGELRSLQSELMKLSARAGDNALEHAADNIGDALSFIRITKEKLLFTK